MTRTPPPDQPLRFLLPSICAALVTLLGLVVMAGWNSGNVALVQLHPSLAPMQFNAALAFVLSGAGLAACLCKHHRLATMLAILLALFSGAVLSQYLFGWDLGLDQAFMNAYITVETSHPGRMAPNAAVCFVLVSCALLLDAQNLRLTGINIPLVGLAVAIVALAATATTGYLAQVETAYGWGELTRMAPNTAVGFLLLGSAILLRGWRSIQELSIKQLRTSLVAVVVLGISLTVAISLAFGTLPLYEQQRNLRNQQLELLLNSQAETFGKHLRQVNSVADRLANTPISNLAAASAALQWTPQLISVTRLLADGQTALHQGPTLRAPKPLNPNSTRQVSLTDASSLGGIYLGITTHRVDGGQDHILLSLEEQVSVLAGIGRQTGALCIYLQHGSDSVLELSAFDQAKPQRRWLPNTPILNPNNPLLSSEIGANGWLLHMQIDHAALHAPASRQLRIAIFSSLAILIAGALIMPLYLRPLTGRMLIHDTVLRAEINQATAQLRHQNTELEQYARITAHDLQSPLRAVVSFLQILKEDHAPQLDSQAQHYVDNAVAGGQRMQALIDGVLVMARSGRRQEAPIKIDLNQELAAVIDDLSQDILKYKASISWDDLPALTFWPVDLRRILQNLISNALKFNDKAERQVHISATRLKNAWQLTVADNGIGIDSKHQQRVFQLFKRLHAGDQYEGLGIGLSQVAKLVTASGGEVWMDSEPGIGSRLHFTLLDEPAEPQQH